MGVPGWGALAGGIGAILGKASTYIPGRVEALKNELEALKYERASLLKGKYDAKKGSRLQWIDNRIDSINILLGNNAKD